MPCAGRKRLDESRDRNVTLPHRHAAAPCLVRAVSIRLIAAGGALSAPHLTMADVAGVAGDRLKSFIERIERLEEEKKALAEDIKEVFAEAKGTGFDVKIMRQIIRIRKMDKDDLDEQETLLDVYKRALGMIPDFSDEEEPKAAE
jgi:uncharacterized protein (UPF0335 family)